MTFRRAAKTDANQPEIVKHFRKLGWSVLIISQLKNCCDLIVAKNGKTFAIEVKDGSRIPSERKLTKGEKKFLDGWHGEWRIIESIEQVNELNEAIE